MPWLLPSLDLQLLAPGGNRDQSFAENADGNALGLVLRLSWRQKVSLLALARESWRRVAQERAGRQWCCGVPSRRPTPGLMLGLSGVGWTCLRLHDPSITESVLI